MKKIKATFILPLIFSVIFFLIGFFTLKDYNVNWDEPGHFNRGQAILRFFLTGQKDYKNLNSATNPRISIYQYSEKTGPSAYFVSLGIFSHPPLNGILASLTNYVFYQKLGVLGDIESYHLFIVSMASILVFLIFYFTAKEYGLFPGLIAFLSLALYPLFLGESHNNIKDPVETTFYALTIYFAYLGITKNKAWIILIASLFGGIALTTKFNILFAVVSVVIWITIYKWKEIMRFKWPFSSKMTITFIVSFIIPWIILIASWPNLWTDTFTNLLKVFSYYKNIGGIVYQPIKYLTFLGFNTYPIKWIILTSPLPILILSFFGIIYSIRDGIREKKKTSILILAWFLIPILRVSIPGTGIYGGDRQIMEFVPAMAILSGIGAKYFVSSLSHYLDRRYYSSKKPSVQQLNFFQIAIILAFVPLIIRLISIHPNETIYFNELYGGLKGAYARELPSAGGDLGNVYRQGVNWLNLHAEKGAKLSLVVNGTPAVPSIFLRADIAFSNDYWSGDKQKGEYIMNTTEVGWDWVIPEKSYYLENFLVPIYEVKVDEAPILKIWKNSPEYTKPGSTIGQE